MTPWVVEIIEGKPYAHQFQYHGKQRLRLREATLGQVTGAKVQEECIVQCNIGIQPPIDLCTLVPAKTESVKLDHEFETLDVVVFSVRGNGSVSLTGDFVPNTKYKYGSKKVIFDDELTDEDQDIDDDLDDKVYNLKSLQNEHDKLEKTLNKELGEIESYYAAKFDTLYQKRCKIVNGVKKGCKKIPGFWLNAMKKNSVLQVEIEDGDWEALESLNNIRSIKNSNGFKLIYNFDQNSYFENNELSVQLVSKDGIKLEEIHGTMIKWKNNMDLTKKKKPIFKPPLKGSPDHTHYNIINQQKMQSEKVSYDRNIKTENVDSFFSFFDSPIEKDIPCKNIGGTGCYDAEAMDEYNFKMSRKLQIGRIFSKEIIPQSWCGESLEDIQGRHKKLEEEVAERRAVTREQYQQKYKNLYRKRSAYLNGPAKVPYFWFKAMMADPFIKKMINKRDAHALKYLKDISCFKKGLAFTLKFSFDANPYFKNSILKKTYQMASDAEMENTVQRVKGSKIEWLNLENNLTTKVVYEEMSTVAGSIKKFVTYETFFDMFTSHEQQMTKSFFKVLMEREFDIFSSFNLNIIPKAFHLFTSMSGEKVTILGKRDRAAFVYGL